jgi:cell division protein FtsB
MEKKRLIEKEQVLNQQIDQAKKDIETYREKEKELTKKIEDMVSAPALHRENTRGSIRK